MGELAFYNHYLNHIPHKKIDSQTGFRCTCGKYAWNCPFWRSVHASLTDKKPIIKNRGYANTFKIFFNILNPLEHHFRFDFKVSKNKMVLDTVFREARKIKKSTFILVDSSKDPRRLYSLLNDPEISSANIYVLYLVRDGRAYIHSFNKDVATIGGLDRRNIFITAFEWIGVQIACRVMLTKYKVKFMTIKYHDFAQSPESFFKAIYRFLSISDSYETTKVLSRINREEYHNLHGNPLRFTKITKIEHDLGWKNQLGFFTKLVIYPLFFLFNRLWVYNSSPKRPYTLK